MSRRRLAALVVVSGLIGCLGQAPEPVGGAGAAGESSDEVGVISQALTSKPAEADATIRAGAPYSNDGSSSVIGVT